MFVYLVRLKFFILILLKHEKRVFCKVLKYIYLNFLALMYSKLRIVNIKLNKICSQFFLSISEQKLFQCPNEKAQLRN
ncbi:hypothetical protein BpHYR1_050139 [Brachionus plicatilis]|uniref:Uncharacterized protein n=1 Tax=Brachionus plicatilis TaxID=10195 RepID=A0A3M7PP29_BRAPC|nr:hypothetical protein BpHYR1_050139 [Brachionus plicatilis]